VGPLVGRGPSGPLGSAEPRLGTTRHTLAACYLLRSVQLIRVLSQQTVRLRGALPFVHVAGDEDPLHAHLQLPRPLETLAPTASDVPPLAAAFLVVIRRHVAHKLEQKSKMETQPPLGFLLLLLSSAARLNRSYAIAASSLTPAL